MKYRAEIDGLRALAVLPVILFHAGFEWFSLSYRRPGVFILVDQDNWRWVMAGNGNHRAYIMSALKKTVLPVSITKVVNRSQVNKWPNVVNGEYSEREAKDIFDIVFRGDTRIRGCY